MYAPRKDSDEVEIVIPFQGSIQQTDSFLHRKSDCVAMSIVALLILGSLVLISVIVWALVKLL